MRAVIATKLVSNIDVETGKRGPGSSSRPEHIQAMADACPNRQRPDQDSSRLCYIRGPEGLLIGLAQELN